jgi:HPt (histidine-containing phosphotransfer) domain-containing protein
MAQVDLSYLEEITGGDQEMIIEMLDLFISDIPEHLKKIKGFYDEKNLIDMGKEAHKVKPTLQYVGFFDMFELIKQLEAYGREENDSEEIPSIISKLETMGEVGVPLLKAKKEELS